ncbi:hypothetical protein K9M18_00710 [Candidatus Woesearchaeota archaeon]|nr:hypothetical protein [Candidatus Woesearchaeota archaeon]MCF8013445.1 hypothetical protein [Candidatus Woesearchaeota archaeon]
MKNITTGVDRLIKLLNQKNKVTLEEVAIELNLEEETVQEWLELLEKEGLVKITSNLSKTWIESNKIEKKIVENAAGEIQSKKEAFARKIEIAIKTLNKDTSGFEEVKREFLSIQSRIKDELDTARKEMKELEQYDKLKKNINKEIEEQQKTYAQFTKAYENQIADFTKKELQIINRLKKEEDNADKLEKSVNELLKTKKAAEETITKAVEDLKTVAKEIGKEMNQISKTEKSIKSIKNELVDFNIHIQKNKEKQLNKLAERLNIDKQKIEQEHKDLLKNAKMTVTELKTYSQTEKVLFKNFETLFGKKLKIKDLIETIQKEKNELKKELEDLEIRVKTFTIITKDPKIKSQMNEIEKTLKKYEERKKTIMSKIIDLTKMIGN